LGLVTSRQEVLKLVESQPRFKQRTRTFSFEQFLHILKEASVRNSRGIKGNFLIDKNMYYEPGVKKKNKSMDGQRLPGLAGSQQQDEDVQLADQYIGNAQQFYIKSLRSSDSCSL